jgi:hypothetical protein
MDMGLRSNSHKVIYILIGIIIAGVGFSVLRHTYRQSAYNYIGSKVVKFEAEVVDDNNSRTYFIPATVQYNACADNLKDLGGGCGAAVSVLRVNWPNGGYTTFPSSCSFRKFNVSIDCQASNSSRSYTVTVLNKKLN